MTGINCVKPTKPAAEGAAFYNAAGIASAEQGRFDDAEAFFRRAIELEPAYAEAYLNLSNLLGRQNRGDEAQDFGRAAVGLMPGYPDEFFRLGVVQAGAKLWEEAVVSFCQAIDLRPEFPAAFCELGQVLEHQGNLAEAEACYLKAIVLQDDYADAYNNLGFIKLRTSRPDEAAEVFRRVISRFPDWADGYNNLGLVLKDQSRLSEAEECFRRAVALEPDKPEQYINLGNLLKYIRRPDEAEKCYHQALSLQPDNYDAYNNLGNLLKDCRRLTEAEAAYKKALDLRPGFPEASFALATLYLLQGYFSKGWQDYDAYRMKKYASGQPRFVRWQGEDLTGRSILLFHEQGFGDTIQFVRYAQKVAALAGHTALCVQKPLAPLMAASFKNIVMCADGEEPAREFDFACPLPSLPCVFNTCEHTIPPAPYIDPGPEVCRAWEERLAGLAKRPRVGVVWAGNPLHSNDRNRSIPFAVFAGILSGAEINWISLQAGDRASDAAADPAVWDFSQELTDFSATAGLIKSLDLVIAVDSAVAHLAGALGKPVWLLLPFAPDWRWQLARDDSPWYEGMRLFRQSNAGDWQAVIVRVKAGLAKYLNKRQNLSSGQK